MKIIKLSLSTFVVLGLLSGCTPSAELTPAQKKELNKFDTSEIKEFSNQLHQAMNEDELLFYAPVSIENAKDYYEEAMEAEQKDEKLAAYLAAKKALKHGYETKKLVKKYLADVADINRRMKIQNTKEIYPDRYEDFLDDYNDLIKTIDEGKTSEALEDKKEVMAEAKDLYGDAVVFRNINKAKLILEKLEDEDLDELVKKHYEQAQNLYESSRLRIKKEPDNHEMIEDVSKKTNEFALYTQTLAQDVFNFRALDKEEQEMYFDKLHRRISELNKDEANNTILPYPIYEKIDRLQEMNK